MECVSVLIDTPPGIHKHQIRELLLDNEIDEFDLFFSDVPGYDNASVLYIERFRPVFRADILRIINKHFYVIDEDFDTSGMTTFYGGENVSGVKPI